MRFLWRCKAAWKTFSAICLCAATAFAFLCVNVCRFSEIEGERVLYLRSASSQGLRTETLSIDELFDVRGESVRFQMETGCDKGALAKEIAKKFGAEILLEEEVCGTVSYYAYTPAFADGIWMGNKKINLHIALGEGVGAVGSPIIFDGF
ncbi:MAG: YwmB family TATA-box binding protein [Clostridia bacterium]|nr:YwmB family TATA-box binding protein [Clostridia bacterium]